MKSADNKADEMTRVPHKWLRQRQGCYARAEEEHSTEEMISQEHRLHHFGVNKTLHLLQIRHPKVLFRREEVAEVIRNCNECQSIDPAPVQWNHGELSETKNWIRLACNVTHYKGKTFLTIIDCGPSRYCIWKWKRRSNHSSNIWSFPRVWTTSQPTSWQWHSIPIGIISWNVQELECSDGIQMCLSTIRQRHCGTSA